MKKSFGFIFVLAVALMFLVGCGSKQETTSTETSTNEEAPTKTVPTKTVDTTPAVDTTEETASVEPVKTMDKKMQTMLNKHIGKIDSLKYMYQDQINKPQLWETWTKGDKMHVKLRELDNVRGDVYVSDIYLDLAAKKAVGYCEAKVYRCPDPNSPVDVNFQKYFRKSPVDWVESITYAEKLADEQMQGRTVWKIQYTEDSKKITMWIDDYYGLPVKIRSSEGSTTNEYLFDNMAINSVFDPDLAHGFVQETYKADN